MSVSLVVVASGVGQCRAISMFVFGFRILQVGGGKSGRVHGSCGERRDESENKHGNGKRIWLGAELSWTPRVSLMWSHRKCRVHPFMISAPVLEVL
ncbi:hypothetical protein DEO72_LG2g2914 [Vigna unguiculata]|uniref:Uncharacterized protein n=1 Tax=Vigna unguiculata TaxID=3917 RepID=A0A4D6L299_VIGUN|nr:hypothetical protein DEO72_LG2g2914 [Vigna unguiculata]